MENSKENMHFHINVQNVLVFVEVWWMQVETSLLLTSFQRQRRLEREKETVKLRWITLRKKSE